ncbi:exopolygalacturonase-like [Silene latifolia]|uniref:exopolygalacturonase-like n=1 Tax=Silene latifolia TaxID=37657 RepID=UPI003D787F5D
MTSNTKLSSQTLALVLGFIFFLCHAKAIRLVSSAPTVFDVTKFGAKGDGKPVYNEDGESSVGMAFIQAWLKACNSIGPATVLIPKGTYAVAQVIFNGPCQSSVTVELQGNIIADPDVSQFPNNQLLVFEEVEGAKLVGGGSIAATRPSSQVTPMDPEKPFVYSELMPSVSLLKVVKFEMSGVRSLNPESFHVLVDNSHEVSITNVNFDSTNMRPVARSDAIFISMSSLVTVTNSQIKVGDACVTVSGGSKDVTISGLTCNYGHGIRVGAQAHETPDYNVNKVKVTNCTFKATKSAVTINPRPQSALGQVSDINFEDLVMDQVHTALTIKQDYLSTPDKPHNAKVSNIHFKNIKGTSIANIAVSFTCSKRTPCEGIEIADIDLKYTGQSLMGKLFSHMAICDNAKVAFIGKHDTLNCKSNSNGNI